MADITLLASLERYRCKRFTLVEERFQTPDGVVERPIVHHPGAVALVVLPEPGQVVLVRQYRYPIRRWTWEIPAGTREPGEDAAVTARRELQEETGYFAETLRPWFSFYPSMGICDEDMQVFLVEGVSEAPMRPDHGELIRPRVVSFAEVRELAKRRDIVDAKTLLTLALLPGMGPLVEMPA